VTLEVDFDGSLRGHTGSESIRRELTSVVNGEIGSSEFSEFLLRRSDEHCRRAAVCQHAEYDVEKEKGRLTVVHEEGMVGTGSNDSNLDSVFGIPSSETVEDAEREREVSVRRATVRRDNKERTH